MLKSVYQWGAECILRAVLCVCPVLPASPGNFFSAPCHGMEFVEYLPHPHQRRFD